MKKFNSEWLSSTNIPTESVLEALRDDYEERASIIEFDGGFSRFNSEMKAAENVVSTLNSSAEIKKFTEIEIQQIVKVFNRLKQWRDEDTQRDKSRTSFKMA